MRRAVRWLMVLGLTGLLAPVLSPSPVVAGDAVVGGACDEAVFDTALATALTGGGGTITFNCGGPATIVFSAEKTITTGNIVIIDGAGQITLDGDEVTRHFMVEAGATLELRNLTLSDGDVDGEGGSIFNSGTLTITGSSFFGNSASVSAGAIASEGSLTVDDSSFVNNAATDVGAIANSGTMEITNSTFIENQGTGTFAGAILNTGSGSIIDSTFNGNTSFFGGAILQAAGNLDISGSTLYDNESLGVGGAIYTQADLTIINSTLSGNTSNLGGALFTTNGITELIAITVTGNTSNSGSLDNDQGGDIILRQTIVADQLVGADCFGTMTSNDNNLDSDNTCNLTGPNDIPNGNADLGGLDDNGGTTLNHLPNPSSDAIDNGGSGCPATDQRGRPRPSGDACDIGSVEVQQSTLALCADYFTGRVYSPLSGQCGAYRVELETPDDYPLAFCINTWTGTLSYTFGAPCSPPRLEHIVPDDGDLLTCVNVYTGLNRWVYNHSQCNAYELPNIIPVA